LCDCVLNVAMTPADEWDDFVSAHAQDIQHAIGALNIDGHSLEFNAEWTELRLDVSLAERELRDVPI